MPANIIFKGTIAANKVYRVDSIVAILSQRIAKQGKGHYYNGMLHTQLWQVIIVI